MHTNNFYNILKMNILHKKDEVYQVDRLRHI